MIKVTAETIVKDGEKGVLTNCSLRGAGEEIVNEALSAIREIIHGVKEEDHVLYAMMMLTMLHDKSVLRGERDSDERKDEAALGLAEAMSEAILKN